MPSIEGFRDYARIAPGEDGSVEACYLAALQHARDSGVREFLFEGEGDPKLNLYVYAIAAHWYDERSFSADSFVQEQATKMRRELIYRRREVV